MKLHCVYSEDRKQIVSHSYDQKTTLDRLERYKVNHPRCSYMDMSLDTRDGRIRVRETWSKFQCEAARKYKDEEFRCSLCNKIDWYCVDSVYTQKRYCMSCAMALSLGHDG